MCINTLICLFNSSKIKCFYKKSLQRKYFIHVVEIHECWCFWEMRISFLHQRLSGLLLHSDEHNLQVLSFIWKQSLWGQLICFSAAMFVSFNTGLHHGEVLQHFTLQRDTRGLQRSRHDKICSPPQLHWCWSLQVSGEAGGTSSNSCWRWSNVCLLLLVERILQAWSK